MGSSTSSPMTSASSTAATSTNPTSPTVQFMSTGASSYSDGKDNFATHTYLNDNGNIQEQTSGTIPQGFFNHFFSHATPTTFPGVVSMILLSTAILAVLTFLLSMFINYRKQGQMRHKVKTIKSVECRLERVISVNNDERGFSLFNKRPLAQAMWNSDLLLNAEYELDEIDLKN